MAHRTAIRGLKSAQTIAFAEMQWQRDPLERTGVSAVEIVGTRRAPHHGPARDMEKRYGIAKTLGLLAFALVCVVALVTPVGANVLLLGGMAGDSVTDPGMLILLGAAMVSAGVSTRRLFFSRKRGL